MLSRRPKIELRSSKKILRKPRSKLASILKRKKSERKMSRVLSDHKTLNNPQELTGSKTSS